MVLQNKEKETGETGGTELSGGVDNDRDDRTKCEHRFHEDMRRH